jgi:hypothetical protein
MAFQTSLIVEEGSVSPANVRLVKSVLRFDPNEEHKLRMYENRMIREYLDLKGRIGSVENLCDTRARNTPGWMHIKF